jgi:dihydrodipicolinate synthase/N-acetylneuraminate lyase
MTAEESKQKYQGVFVPAPTPMRRDYSLNLRQFKPCIDLLANAGMGPGTAVYVVLGAGGEHMHLSSDERKAVAEAAVEASAGRLPVFVGISHNETRAAVDLARHAEQAGADGLQLEPPYYFAGTADDIFEYFHAVSDAVSFGITAYDTPWTSGFDMNRRFIERLATLQNVIGLKWYSANQKEWTMVIRDFSERFSILSNYFGTFNPTAFVLGARGYVSQAVNFSPRNSLKILAALRRGDYADATARYLRVDGEYYEAVGRLFGEGYAGEGNFIKACMPLVGIDCGPARPPHRIPPTWFPEHMREVLTAAGEAVVAAGVPA